jgi:hypothetical protein
MAGDAEEAIILAAVPELALPLTAVQQLGLHHLARIEEPGGRQFARSLLWPTSRNAAPLPCSRTGYDP